MHLEAGIDEIAKKELLEIKTDSEERIKINSIRAQTVWGTLYLESVNYGLNPDT